MLASLHANKHSIIHGASRGSIENEQSTSLLCSSGNSELPLDHKISKQQLYSGSGLKTGIHMSGRALENHQAKQEVSGTRTDSPTLTSLMNTSTPQPSLSQLSREHGSTVVSKPGVPSLSELMSGQPAQPNVPSLSELMSGQPAQPNVPSLSELMSSQSAQPNVPSLSELMSSQPAKPSVPSLSELMSSQPAQPNVPSLSELMSSQLAQPSLSDLMSSQPAQSSLSLLAMKSSSRLHATSSSKNISPLVPVFEGKTSSKETPRPQPSLSDLMSKHVTGSLPMSHKETHPPIGISTRPHQQQTDFVFKPLSVRGHASDSAGNLSLSDLAKAHGSKEIAQSAPSHSLTLSDLAKRQTNPQTPSLLSLGQDTSLPSLNQHLRAVNLSNDNRTSFTIDFQRATHRSESTKSFRLVMNQHSVEGRVQKLTNVLRKRVLSRLAKKYKRLILFNFSTPSPDDSVREKQKDGFRKKV